MPTRSSVNPGKKSKKKNLAAGAAVTRKPKSQRKKFMLSSPEDFYTGEERGVMGGEESMVINKIDFLNRIRPLFCKTLTSLSA